MDDNVKSKAGPLKPVPELRRVLRSYLRGRYFERARESREPVAPELSEVLGLVNRLGEFLAGSRELPSLDTVLLDAIVTGTVEGILVVDRAGKVMMANERFATMWRIPPDVLSSGDDERLLQHVVAQLANPEAFLERVQQLYDNPEKCGRDVVLFDDERIFDRYSAPLRARTGQVLGRVWYFRDLSENHELRELQEEKVRLQQQIIEAQDRVLRELAAPLLPVAEGVVVMPLVGPVDQGRVRQSTEMLLQGVADRKAVVAIIDMTGARSVAASVADGLRDLTLACRLLGAEVVLTGLQPEVAQKMAELEIELPQIQTLGTLQAGIAYALTRN